MSAPKSVGLLPACRLIYLNSNVNLIRFPFMPIRLEYLHMASTAIRHVHIQAQLHCAVRSVVDNKRPLATAKSKNTCHNDHVDNKAPTPEASPRL
jgi:hypothetical protein